MSDDELASIAGSLSGGLTRSRRYSVISVAPRAVPEACRMIASLSGYYHLSTITGVDVGESIEVFYHFWRGNSFAAVKTSVPKSDPRIPSIQGVLPSSLLYEAEVKDLLGVTFEGNPLMGRKLLLPDSYPVDAPPPLRREADPEKVRRAMELE